MGIVCSRSYQSINKKTNVCQKYENNNKKTKKQKIYIYKTNCMWPLQCCHMHAEWKNSQIKTSQLLIGAEKNQLSMHHLP